MFSKISLDLGKNSFNKLSKLNQFEDILKGRKGAILAEWIDNKAYIVRTTSIYKKPAQPFQSFHYFIMAKIEEKFPGKIELNNALIEIYTGQYWNMGFHTDQSLDLKENSYICLFSCYEKETVPEDIRVLEVKNKKDNKSFKLSLDHNSAILFSTTTNHEHLHKITLPSRKSSNKWLGITFRLSKTFVHFIDHKPYLNGDKLLKIATEEERKEFYKHKSKENKEIYHTYPTIDYTISPSDLIEVTQLV